MVTFKKWLLKREETNPPAADVPGSSIYPGWEAARKKFWADPESPEAKEAKRMQQAQAAAFLGGDMGHDSGVDDPDGELEACRRRSEEQCQKMYKLNQAAKERKARGEEVGLFSSPPRQRGVRTVW